MASYPTGRIRRGCCPDFQEEIGTPAPRVLRKFMTDRIEIYDTTLRDGSQGEGVNFSIEDKCRVAEQLDDFGVDFIEGGWPGSNPRDLAFFERARGLKLTHARVAAFGSTRRHTLSCDDDPSIQSLLKAETSVVTIFGKSWLLHVTDALRLNPEA